MTCCVDDCKKSLKIGFSFPKNEERQRKWIEAIGKSESWKPILSKHKICFRHFREEDYKILSEFGKQKDYN